MKGKQFTAIWGIMLIISAGICIYFAVPLSAESPEYFTYIQIGTAVWNLVTGVGILLRKKWGYYLLKFVLYILLLSFPIGTIISYYSLKYMKNNNIKELFQN